MENIGQIDHFGKIGKFAAYILLLSAADALIPKKTLCFSC